MLEAHASDVLHVLMGVSVTYQSCIIMCNSTTFICANKRSSSSYGIPKPWSKWRPSYYDSSDFLLIGLTFGHPLYQTWDRKVSPKRRGLGGNCVTIDNIFSFASIKNLVDFKLALRWQICTKTLLCADNKTTHGAAKRPRVGYTCYDGR